MVAAGDHLGAYHALLSRLRGEIKRRALSSC